MADLDECIDKLDFLEPRSEIGTANEPLRVRTSFLS